MHPRERGAFVALEPEPSPHGTWAIIDGRAVLADETVPRGTLTYLPHEATCEAAGRKRDDSRAMEG